MGCCEDPLCIDEGPSTQVPCAWNRGILDADEPGPGPCLGTGATHDACHALLIIRNQRPEPTDPSASRKSFPSCSMACCCSSRSSPQGVQGQQAREGRGVCACPQGAEASPWGSGSCGLAMEDKWALSREPPKCCPSSLPEPGATYSQVFHMPCTGLHTASRTRRKCSSITACGSCQLRE